MLPPFLPKMRVYTKSLLAVLDPESARARSRAGGVTLHAAAALLRRPADSGEGSDECSPFDLLHTERGFAAFDHWLRRVLASTAAASAERWPPAELGILWPQAFCPPTALHEHAFLELVRAFAECSDSEALDLFDILDHDFLGMLGPAQAYLAMCLIAALGSHQLTKFLYFHSSRLFGVLAKGCMSSAPDHVSWARLLVLLRVLGAPVPASSASPTAGAAPATKTLKYDDFLEVMFPIVVQLDRGGGVGESTVINDGDDRIGSARSRTCAIL